MGDREAAAASSGSEHRGRGCRPGPGRTRDRRPCGDLQSPQRGGCSRFTDLNHGDSPGDVDVSQDICWDSTSPTPTGSGLRNNRVVEISDIVNRIAPKSSKPKGSESPLLQWIGDVPCTPEVPKPRVRKKSCRLGRVEDLVKLALQFDENMHQDKVTLERLNTINNNNNVGQSAAASCGKAAAATEPDDVKHPPRLTPSGDVEAELHNLFDRSTQGGGGRLSQSSSNTSCSLESAGEPVTSAAAKPTSAEKPRRAEGENPCGSSTSNCDDFDDDWENDDLLNESFVLEMTQIPHQRRGPPPSDARTALAQSCAAADSPRQRTGRGSLQDLCPKTKTTNRSTFRLGPGPLLQPREVSVSGGADLRPESRTLSKWRPEEGAEEQGRLGAFAKDSLWDDGDDDQLFYQVCDSVEGISSSQPPLSDGGGTPAEGGAPVPIGQPSSRRQSAQAFVRSNSLPGNSSGSPGYPSRNLLTRGSCCKSPMSRSLPGNQPCRDLSGTFPGVDVRGVKAAPTTSSPARHAALKRNLSDAAAVGSKVFVGGRTTGRCSAAEIERKKQEALARRRVRLQNTPKP